MKRTGVIVARQLKKHNQPRVQTLAMRLVRIAAWQMVRCERAPILGRICDMALRRNVEGRIHQLVQGRLSEQHAVETPSPRQTDLLGTTFHAILEDAWIPKLKACNTWTEWLSLTRDFEYSWHVMLNLKPLESTRVRCSCGTRKRDHVMTAIPVLNAVAKWRKSQLTNFTKTPHSPRTSWRVTREMLSNCFEMLRYCSYCM